MEDPNVDLVRQIVDSPDGDCKKSVRQRRAASARNEANRPPIVARECPLGSRLIAKLGTVHWTGGEDYISHPH